MTLAQRLSTLVALALLPALAFQAWSSLELRNEAEAAYAAQAVAESRDAQANMSRIAEGVRQLLLALSEVPAIRSGDNPGCNSYLKMVADQFANYALLAANEPDGEIICNSLGTKPKDYSNGGRAYHLRAMASGTFAVGDLVTGKMTNVRSIHFALPFRRTDGSVGGIVLAGLDQTWLANQIASASVPTGSLSLVIDPSGVAAAASVNGRPITDGWVGRPVAPEFLSILGGPPGAVAAVGPDGVRRRYGIVVPDPMLKGMRVAVGLNETAGLAELRKVSLRNAAAMVAGIALAICSCIVTARRVVLRPLERLAAAADRVRAGELGAQADLGRRAREIREVGAAFDSMSATLAQREQAVRESEARFRHMADSAPALIWMTDPGGRLVFANLHFTFMFGRPTEELVGDGWVAVVVPEDLPRFRHGFVAAFSTKRSFRAEIRVRRSDGAIRWLGCEGVPRLDESGTFLGYTGCAVDITEARLSTEALEARITERTADLRRVLDALQHEITIRGQAEEALRQSQKMEAVGQLTGGIAHDFNNMLQGISGALEAIQRRIDQGRAGEIQAFVAGARKTVDRAAALTNRLLAFARRQALQPASVEPDSLAQSLEDLVRRTVGPGVTVEFRLGSHGWFVRCDQSQLENTLLNLAINSRDAMPDGGTLNVTTSQITLAHGEGGKMQGASQGEYVAISVADTGIGMDDMTQSRAFEPFFTTKPHGGGTGLGLSQVYGFVHQSNGIVRLESTPGQGTTVTILLPRLADVGSVALDQPPILIPAEAAAGANLLLVEDEEQVRSTTADYLEGNGHRVRVAANASEALAHLEDNSPVDLLITDVGLPGVLNGRQAADAARARRPGLKVLFITGYAAGRWTPNSRREWQFLPSRSAWPRLTRGFARCSPSRRCDTSRLDRAGVNRCLAATDQAMPGNSPTARRPSWRIPAALQRSAAPHAQVPHCTSISSFTTV